MTEPTPESRVQADHDLENEALWSAPVDPPNDRESPRRRPRRAQVAIRLDEALLATVQRIADQAGVGYTTMLRQWIEERAEAERIRAEVSDPRPDAAEHVIALWYSGEEWVVARRLGDGSTQVVYTHPAYLTALRAARDVATTEGARQLDIQWFRAPAGSYWERVAESAADQRIGERPRYASEG